MKFRGTPIGNLPQFDFEIDGVFIKEFELKKNQVVPQHAHPYSHVTILAWGKLRVWRGEDPNYKDFSPGRILIPANTKHQFLALRDSRLYCIHNAAHAAIASENELELV